MTWLYLIFQIISSLPSIINLIREIIALIKGLPAPAQNVAKMRLFDMVKRIKADGINVSNLQELHSFRSELSTMSKMP